MDEQIVTEVPDLLKRLARIVVRAFYSKEDTIVLDALVRHVCVKEDDLSELLYMEKRALRQSLVHLKKDKLIKSMNRTETFSPEEKPQKVSYFFINYRSFVNAVKYKLDTMRRKLEAEEKQARNRQFYICPRCGSEFGDLMVDRLFDLMEGVLKCEYCKEVLEENEGKAKSGTGQSTVARLNEVIRPLMDLIRQTENIHLAPEILEPEPTEIAALKNRRHVSNVQPGSGMLAPRDEWSGSYRGRQALTMAQQTLEIDIAETNTPENKAQSTGKDQPVWLRETTVEGAEPVEAASFVTKDSKDTVTPIVKPQETFSSAELLSYEKKPSQKKRTVEVSVADNDVKQADSSSDDEASTSEEEFEKTTSEAKRAKRETKRELDALEMNLAARGNAAPTVIEAEIDDDDDEEEVTIKIGDALVPLADVTDEMIDKMTAEEREVYDRLCREAVEDYY
ncbi:general transcription factor IIE subunit 1-like [Oscarella lobularis]|uniref:general transcription factor IIE subunit 1-like n=1 Tax=Oscarella lobularis TaxID=121494 RepID=UPI003313EF73